MSKTFQFILTLVLMHSGGNLSAQNVIWQDSTDKRTAVRNLYFQINIKYPQEAMENNIQGIVTISFDIDSTCSIKNRKVIKGLGYGCDEAALSVLVELQKKMKKEKKNKCEKLDNVVIPITFKLH